MREFSLVQKLSVLCTILLVVLAVLTAPVFAQATAAFGTVSGTVLDASGAPVPTAKVTVSNASLGLNREITTTDGGIFVAPALVHGGGYKVTVGKVGFASAPRRRRGSVPLPLASRTAPTPGGPRRAHLARGQPPGWPDLA